MTMNRPKQTVKRIAGARRHQRCLHIRPSVHIADAQNRTSGSIKTTP